MSCRGQGGHRGATELANLCEKFSRIYSHQFCMEGSNSGAASVDKLSLLRQPGGDIDVKLELAFSILTDSHYLLPRKVCTVFHLVDKLAGVFSV